MGDSDCWWTDAPPPPQGRDGGLAESGTALQQFNGLLLLVNSGCHGAFPSPNTEWYAGRCDSVHIGLATAAGALACLGVPL